MKRYKKRVLFLVPYLLLLVFSSPTPFGVIATRTSSFDADGDFIEQDIECYAMDYASSAKNKYKTPDYMTNVEQKK